MQEISLCLTNWNRYELLLKSFEKVLFDDRVSEIVISDDCSDIEVYERIVAYSKLYPKIKVFRNDARLGVHGNKHQSVFHATKPWCIVFDSDNEISKEYIDKLFESPWNSNRILAPDFAEPAFDYRMFQDIVFMRKNIRQYIGKRRFDALLNTMNYFVNREQYLEVWQEKRDIIGADSIFFNYLWIASGRELRVVRGLRYKHLVHDASYYQSVARASVPLSKHYEMLLKRMR
jgi:glycosyltransferase involved in cell wall biosynthesis